MFDIRDLSADLPVLIAGPTASGKSALALRIAQAAGGVVINADAIQVYANWRVLTARPGPGDLARAPHALYGHVDWHTPYSVGHWLRDLAPLLVAHAQGGGPRPVIVGGTGLYFRALTEGLAEIPPTPPALRAQADAMPLAALVAALDAATADAIDLRNRARVQRAWEVLTATGRGMARWQAETPAPLLPLSRAVALRVDAPVDWLNDRIARRFDQMLASGALEEARANLPGYDPALPSMKAIGAPELIAHLRGEITRKQAREAATIATRQYAKRQRTWFRARMTAWRGLAAPDL